MTDRKEYRREYMREYRAMRKKHHLCTECGEQDAFTMSGHSLCEKCSEKRKRSVSKKGQKNEYFIERRKKRIAEGRCTECGKPTWNGLKTCMDCTIKNRERLAEKRRENGVLPKWMWKDMGLCTQCGGTRTTRFTAFGGEPITKCERCYQNSLVGLEKGREAYLLKYSKTWGEYQEDITQKLNERGKNGRTTS